MSTAAEQFTLPNHTDIAQGVDIKEEFDQAAYLDIDECCEVDDEECNCEQHRASEYSEYLEYSSLEDNELASLTKFLMTNPNLTALNLNQSNVSGTVEGLGVLFTHPSLTSLNLDGNEISEQGAVNFAKSLPTNLSISTLILSGNAIGLNGSRAIAEALKVNKGLTYLNMSFNSTIPVQYHRTRFPIKEKQDSFIDVTSFATALCTNRTLTSLKLECSRVNDNGARALANMLQTNHTLNELGLGHNQIGDPGVTDLTLALLKNKSLTLLNLQNNAFTERGTRVLLTLLTINKNIRFRLTPYSNKYKVEQETLAAEAARKNQEAKILQEIDTITIQRQKTHFNWGSLSIVIAFFKANRQHPLRESIIPLIPTIDKIAKAPDFTKMGSFPIPCFKINTAILNTKFFTNQTNTPINSGPQATQPQPDHKENRTIQPTTTHEPRKRKKH